MGEGIILWVQQYANNFWDSFFGFITNLGSENFYLIFIPFIYWCVNKSSGIRLALIFSVSGIANPGLKEFFATTRPDPLRVRVLMAETGGGYAFPSGHTQGASSFWFVLAKEFNKRWLIIVSCLMVFLIGFSRIYLGLHWPIDVLGGLIFGLIIVFGGLALMDWLEKPFQNLRLPVQFIIAALAPLILLLISRDNTPLALIGNMIGFSIGAIIEREWIGFSEKGTLVKQLTKLVLGLAILFVLRFAIKALFPETAFFRIFRYGLIGFTAAAILPYVFVKIDKSS